MNQSNLVGNVYYCSGIRMSTIRYSDSNLILHMKILLILKFEKQLCSGHDMALIPFGSAFDPSCTAPGLGNTSTHWRWSEL